MDLQSRFTDFAMMGASWVMWVLVALSIVGFAIILERAIALWRTGDDLARLREELASALRGGDLDRARARLARSPALEARIVTAGIDAAAGGAAAAEETLQGAAQLARLQMERRLAFLGTLGSNAPFIGLLGTVIGIIRAFHELDAAGGKVTAGLMAEVGEALVATAIGILVALPAVAAFNYFQRVIKARLTGADALGRELLAYLETRAKA